MEIDQLVSWAEPDKFEATPADLIRHGLGEQGIFLAGLADGEILAFSDSLEIQIFPALLTRNGGDEVRP